MRFRIPILPVLLLLAAVAAAGEPPPTVVKSFNLKHRTVTEASQLVQLFLSETGSLTVHPQQALVTVQDSPEVITLVSDLLKAYDTPPVPFVLQLELWQASNDQGTSKGENVDPRVRRLFQYASFRKVAQARVESDGSSPLHADLGPAYLVRSTAVQRRLQLPRYPIKVAQQIATPAAASRTGRVKPAKEPVSPNAGYPEKQIHRLLSNERIVLQNLSLERREAAPGGTERLLQVLRTNVVLSLGQRVVLGASAAEDSGRALLLILKVQPLRSGGKG